MYQQDKKKSRRQWLVGDVLGVSDETLGTVTIPPKSIGLRVDLNPEKKNKRDLGFET